MRPQTFQDFVIDLAKNDPTTVSVRSLADAGDSAHPYGVVITTGHGESRWQFVGQLPEGERHREDGGDPAAVEGTPLPAGESPQANDDPETWLAALLSKAESPQVAAVERWSTREGNRPDHVGLTITFYNTARIFARRM
ncbi:hypothetical protein MUU72_31255 [Streptomyces sp. RS10V-4]|uniref:hypothetical protein n=1 Tax=Streptomyces rhizoryzae TaxID=2932493 RepID=UPI002003BD23|nr:hypothetical protein [Streptomyces rhizoryzae]MCK7627520.1 hypothetical protein [Streptomyces rhizoryzae]